MGYLMKEALKALCGVNQWSYAVFWKIGCHNPKLLIWEECYYESLPSSNTSHKNGVQVGDRVHLLVDKMMMSNQVSVVGEGLVGRAAFTGDHQWFVSGSYCEVTHPAEVLNEVGLQFSAGIQTVAVIPVIPHGVVQFGSPLPILENVGFVHDVRTLILQLGCVPSAFMADNYIAKDNCMFGLPVAEGTVNPVSLPGNPGQMNTSASVACNFNPPRNFSEVAKHVNQSSNSLLTQFQDNLQVSGSSFLMPNLTQGSCKSLEYNHAISKKTGGAAMPLKGDSILTQPTSNNSVSGISCLQSSSSRRDSSSALNSTTGQQVNAYDTAILSMQKDLDVGSNGQRSQSFQTSSNVNTVLHDGDSSFNNLVRLLNSVDQAGSSSILGGVSYHGQSAKNGDHTAMFIPGKVQNVEVKTPLKAPSMNVECISSVGFIPDNFGVANQVKPGNKSTSKDTLFQSSAGDDLFDVLGLDFKNKLLNTDDSTFSNICSVNMDNQIKDVQRFMNSQNMGPGTCAEYEKFSESGVFSSSGSDHLLDAVISGISSASRQTSDDDMSCKTTMSMLSSSSVPSTPHNNPSLSDLISVSDTMQRQMFGVSNPAVRLVEPLTGSASGKNEGGNHSVISTTYGSQISSWIEQGATTSVSTANSKKGDDGSKSNRKRLKPGENPRPRPKDRQMIQDRVKELRDIVPNGAKCSIDSLLERTIKHMLFLQSVTKHADKLKQTESKVDEKNGGMMLRDNFEGGATWAYELGSQTTVCPIVVEDLNAPRQLLIEMLCEERGFFLEIADIVRGLGLTILKGVMEARNDKIWARFAVEADRDVTRMEVFISLVHLLEETLKSNTASVHGTSDVDMAVYPASMTAKQQLVGPVVCGEPSAM